MKTLFVAALALAAAACTDKYQPVEVDNSTDNVVVPSDENVVQNSDGEIHCLRSQDGTRC